MDIDIGNLVYIAFVAIIIIVNLFTKKKKPPQRQGPQNQNPDTVGPVPVDSRKSFEELLAEFTNPEPQAAPTPAPAPTPKPKPVAQSTYVAQPVQPKKPQPTARQAEAKKHSIMKTQYGKFEEFKKDKKESSPYAEGLKDLDSAKKAFVYSEIFKRKF